MLDFRFFLVFWLLSQYEANYQVTGTRQRRGEGLPRRHVIFYGPDDKKASKVVLGIIPSEESDPQQHKWFRKSPDADLRYDIDLQNTWLEIISREGVRRVAMIEEIYGCPHEEGVDYPVGEVCPECPFWADRQLQLSRSSRPLRAGDCHLSTGSMGHATRLGRRPGFDGGNLGKME